MFISHNLITYIVRGLQALWAILVLGLAAFVVDKFSNGRAGYNVACAVLTLVYLAYVFAVPKFILPLSILVCEIILTILWLAAFAAAADEIGSTNCDWFSDFRGLNSYKHACQAYKAVIAFGVFSWLTFAVSLGLVITYQILPSRSNLNMSSMTASGVLLRGGIYPLTSLVATADPEAGVAAAATADSEAGAAEPKTTQPEGLNVFVAEDQPSSYEAK